MPADAPGRLRSAGVQFHDWQVPRGFEAEVQEGEELCRFEAISATGPVNSHGSATCRVDPPACEGCGVCARFCPAQAITLHPSDGGEWFVSETRFGPLVHARRTAA